MKIESGTFDGIVNLEDIIDKTIPKLYDPFLTVSLKDAVNIEFLSSSYVTVKVVLG